MVRNLPVALFAAVLFTTPAALAFDLRWEAPAPCPDGAAARARLDRGDDLTGLRLTARVTVTAASTRRWEAEVETDDGDAAGRRTLRGASCVEVSDAALLVLSLAIDGAQFDAPVVHPSTAAGDEPALALPPGVVVTAVQRRVRTRGGVMAVAGVRGGLLPSMAGYGAVTAFVERDRLRGEVRAAMAGGQAWSLDAGPRGTLGAAWVGAQACWSWLRRPVAVRTCGGIEVGMMRGTSENVRVPGRGASSWTALTAGLSVQYGLTRNLGVLASAELSWMADRPGFVVLGEGVVWAPDALGGAASAGLAWRW